MYKLYATDKFKKAKERLSKEEKKQIIKAVVLLQQDPRYPGLKSKKIKGQENLMECRVNKDIRIIWQYREDVIVLLAVGRHKIVEL